MNPLFATFLCACAIAGLFYLDRDKSTRTSTALWLPVLWIGLAGSRPVTTWLGVAPTTGNVQLEGSPLDAVIFGLLSATAIGVLIYRNRRTRTILAANWPILIYFFFCLISVIWSFHPDVAFKRWTKAIGDLAMVLVVITDARPMSALSRLVSRLGYILLPISLLLIKYYGELGRGYTPDGEPMNVGIATDKNSLGVLLFTISLYTIWRVNALFRAKGERDRRRHLFAQCTLLLLGLVLMQMAHSATSIACFVLGSGLIFATGLRAIKGQPNRVHALCLGIFVVGGLLELFGGQAGVAHALGRQSDLSGRTEIWAALLPAVHNPIVGAGFESFWISPDREKFWHALAQIGWWHAELLNEAHNGYLEVYLNLGWVGVILIASILIGGYKRAVAVFRLNPPVSSLTLAYIVASAFYCITEAGFRMMNLMWVFLLLAIVTASGVKTGFFGERKLRIVDSRKRTALKISAAMSPTRKATAYRAPGAHPA